MTRTELNKYIHPEQLARGGRALEACYLHFCGGLSKAEAAREAGISRQAAGKAINRIQVRIDRAKKNGIHGTG